MSSLIYHLPWCRRVFTSPYLVAGPLKSRCSLWNFVILYANCHISTSGLVAAILDLWFPVTSIVTVRVEVTHNFAVLCVISICDWTIYIWQATACSILMETKIYQNMVTSALNKYRSRSRTPFKPLQTTIIDWLTALRHISTEWLLVPRNVAK